MDLHTDDMRTTFAYCPKPTRRSDLAYRLGRDAFAGPVYTFAAFALAGGVALLVVGILRIAGRA
jgi:hypothetical protein